MTDGRSRERAKRVGEWFLQRRALEAARAHVPPRDQLAGRGFDQVRLLRQVARQVAESTEEVNGRRPAVLLTLYREMVYWSLAAAGPSAGGTGRDLPGLWQETPRDRLRAAAGNDENLAAVHRLLVDLSPPAALDASDEDVDRVRAFADALYDDLLTPRRRVTRVLAQRWLRLLGAAAVLLVVGFGIRRLALGPNLVSRDLIRVSSTLEDCAPDPSCAALMFHTGRDNAPWVEFDLGAPKPIRVIKVDNRPDCCEDRGVPIVAEISMDRSHWKQVGRQEQVFSTWKVKVPRTVTRYVRLRVPRPTFFGFADVTIR